MSQRSLTYAPMAALVPADVNPKLHDLPSLIASLERFGFVAPAILDERTGKLAAGHGRREALISMRENGDTPPDGVFLDEDGDWLLPVVRGWASRNDAEALAYIIADNQLTIAGGWHMTSLAPSIETLINVDPVLIDTLGFAADDIDEIIRRGMSEAASVIRDEDDDPWQTPAGSDGDGEDEGDDEERTDGGPEKERIDYGRTHTCPSCGFEYTETKGE